MRSYRTWRLERAYRRAARVSEKLMRRCGATVRSGPFEGMGLLAEAVGSALAPKLVGSYEVELHEVISSLLAPGRTRVVDIGSAEGYYAVGLALRLPAAEVWAFDLNPAACQATARLAAHNGVAARLRLGAECTHASLDELCVEGALIVCDIEGAERTLLDPARAPALRRADIIVELHAADITDLFRNRFSATHAIEIIESRPRNPADYPWLVEALGRADAEVALCEFRPSMAWGILRRKPGRP